MDVDEEEEEGGGLEDEDHELRLVIEGAGAGLSRYGVSLDALLVGHEDWVTGVTWRPLSGRCGEGQVGEEEGEGGLALLSACMDRSLILWRPEGKGGLWAPHVRLGDVGSDIGGPIGGNLLGFMGCDFAPDGTQSHEPSETLEWKQAGGAFYERPCLPLAAQLAHRASFSALVPSCVQAAWCWPTGSAARSTATRRGPRAGGVRGPSAPGISPKSPICSGSPPRAATW